MSLAGALAARSSGPIRRRSCLLAILIAALLGAPGHAQLPEPDSIGEMRLLRDRALASGDAGAAVEAVRFALPAAAHERIAAFLVLEDVLRRSGDAEGADSVVLYACSWDCAQISSSAQALHGLVGAELAGGGPRLVTRAVRSLLGARAGPSLPSTLQAGLGLHGDPVTAVRAAAEAAAGAGDAATAAELWDAYAYTILPDRTFAGGFSDASNALEASRRALELREMAGDPVAGALTRSLMAIAAVRANQREQVDSAAIWAAAAYESSSGAPNAIRGLIRRRGAVIAAAEGDVATAERLLAETIARHTEPGALDAAWHRLFLARELADAGAAGAALRHSREAYAVLREADVPPALRARDALVHAEAHRLNPATDSAIHFFSSAARQFVAVGDEAKAVASYLAAAEHAFEHGRTAEMEAPLVAAVEALGSLPADGAGLHARFLNLLGMGYFVEGDWTAARTHFEQASAMVTPADAEWYEARRYLAVLDIAEERTEGAVTSPWESALTWRNTPGSSIPEPPRADDRPLTQGLTHTYAAMRHIGRSELTEGTAELRSALELLARAGHEPSLRRAQGVAGILFAQLGRPDSASHYLRLAGDLAPADAIATDLGDATHSAGAVDALRERVRASDPQGGLRLLHEQLATSRETGDRIAEARALEVLGYWHFRRRAPVDPATATAYYDSAAVVLNDIPQHRLEDWQRVQLAEQFGRLREESVLAWLARSSELGETVAAFGAAAAADRGRSIAFEWLSGLRSGMFARVLDAYDPSAGRTLPEIGAELYEVPFEYRAFDAPARVTISYLQSADTLITWLHVSESAGSGRVEVFRTPLAADSLAAVVGRVRGGLGIDSGPDRAFTDLEDVSRGFGIEAGGDVESALADAAELLLPRALINRLPQRADILIVPSGPISTVPFVALPIAGDTVPLGSRFPVRYLPSLMAQRWDVRRSDGPGSLPSAAAQGGSIDRAEWLARALVLGNPTMPVIELEDAPPLQLTQLPGAEAEARAVAELLGVRPLTGREATIEVLREQAEQATVIHLATHGFAFGDEERVGDSFVALAPGGGHDGVLTVDELLRDGGIRLTAAELVVLSACQTGLGQLTASEGTLGLQRAFLAVGAASALVSLWNVSDEATNLLMQSFYRAWLGGAGKGEALRRAQQEVRGEPGSEFHHPRYWAAFQLVGQG